MIKEKHHQTKQNDKNQYTLNINGFNFLMKDIEEQPGLGSRICFAVSKKQPQHQRLELS